MMDMEYICKAESIEWEKLRGRTILVTGATGLIGTTLANALAYTNKKMSLGIKIIGIGRNAEKAKAKLDSSIFFQVVDVSDKVSIEEPIDYIVHAANPTSSSFFVNNPVKCNITSTAKR